MRLVNLNSTLGPIFVVLIWLHNFQEEQKCLSSYSFIQSTLIEALCYVMKMTQTQPYLRAQIRKQPYTDGLSSIINDNKSWKPSKCLYQRENRKTIMERPTNPKLWKQKATSKLTWR